MTVSVLLFLQLQPRKLGGHRSAASVHIGRGTVPSAVPLPSNGGNAKSDNYSINKDDGCNLEMCTAPGQLLLTTPPS